ncbi:lipopolysaccharide-induced tumor necrosis factor-alpha factor homolog [Periplaneta americana]|uniref:lipopolysaccharide-induced tumor necrosis factor-alpha factor homolog n=1 Tax=Periplaneta americana TaxID=6978 RepID=UPI0037E905BE
MWNMHGNRVMHMNQPIGNGMQPAYSMQPGLQPLGVMPPAVIVQPTQMGKVPRVMECPACHEQIETNVQHETSMFTHLVALVLCICFFPVACVPYCIKTCKSANHYCPKCGAFLGGQN